MKHKKQSVFFLLEFLSIFALFGIAFYVFAATEAALWEKVWTTTHSETTYDIAAGASGSTYTIGFFAGAVFKQGPNGSDGNPLWTATFNELGPARTKAVFMDSAKTNVYVHASVPGNSDMLYRVDPSTGVKLSNSQGFGAQSFYETASTRDSSGRRYLVGYEGVPENWSICRFPSSGGWCLSAFAAGIPTNVDVDNATGDAYVIGCADNANNAIRITKHNSSNGALGWNKSYTRAYFAPAGDTQFSDNMCGTLDKHPSIKFVSPDQLYITAPSYKDTITQHVLLAKLSTSDGSILGANMVDSEDGQIMVSGKRIAVSPGGVIYVGGESEKVGGIRQPFIAKFDSSSNSLPFLSVQYAEPGIVSSTMYGGGGVVQGETADYFYQAAGKIVSGVENYRLIKYGPNSAPVASNQSASTNYQTAKSIALSGSDANGCGQSFTFAVITQPANGSANPTSGTATCSGGNLSANVAYTPNAGFSGGNSFTFKFNDSVVDSNIASVSVTVNAVAPTIVSPTATSITSSSATLGANVTSNGGAALSARGTCWGTSPSPTTYCLAEGGAATGIFSHSRVGLPSGTLIYFRGYATNSAGTGYSSDGTFTTSSSDTTPPATTASGTAPPGGSAYSFGLWTNQNVGVALSCADGGTGCASGYPKYCPDITNTCAPGTAYSGRVDISTPGTSYMRFYSRDNAGNTESTQSRTIRIDKTLPTNPSNLTATAASCSQINLSWTGSTDSGGSGLKEYIVYNASNGAEIARTTSTSYSHTGRSASAAYSYYVKAQDNAGNVSGASNTASATTPSCGGSLSVASVNPSSGPTTGGTSVIITGTGFSNGTAGFWHMDETSGTSVADSSGNNNTAIANGATIVAGKYGNARSFNGSSNTVTVPLATNPTVYTLAAWVKPSTVGSGSIIARTSSCGPTCAWSHQLRLTSTGRFEHYAYDGGLKSVIGSTVVVPGQWYFVVGTAQNGGIMRLYVNSNEEGAPVSLGTLWTGGDRYVLGSNSGGGINYFNGTLDEVRIYNRALSASEISALYASNADTNMTASFGGSNVSPTFTNSTQLSASTPAHAAGAVSVGVTNFDGASASRANSYTYIEPIPPSQCNDTLDNDGDLLIDTNDAGCSSPSDDSEGSNNLTLSASPVLLTATVVGGSSALATSSATFVTITPQAGFPPGSQVTLIFDKSASHAVAQNLVSRFVRAGAIMLEVTLTFSDPPTPQSVVFRLGVPHNTTLGNYAPIVIRAKDTDKTTNVTLRAQDPAGNTGER